MRALEEDLHERPAVAYETGAELLERLLGVEASKAAIRRAIRRLGCARKKGRWAPVSEADSSRSAWRVVSVEKTAAERLAFVGQMGSDTSLSPT